MRSHPFPKNPTRHTHVPVAWSQTPWEEQLGAGHSGTSETTPVTFAMEPVALGASIPVTPPSESPVAAKAETPSRVSPYANWEETATRSTTTNVIFCMLTKKETLGLNALDVCSSAGKQTLKTYKLGKEFAERNERIPQTHTYIKLTDRSTEVK
jgi:hypothetical protein